MMCAENLILSSPRNTEMKLKTLNIAISLALTASVLALAGCGGSNGTNGTNGSIFSTAVEFKSISPAITSDEKNIIRTTNEVTIAGEKQAIAYNTLMKTGDTNNGETFGVVKDYTDTVILEADLSPMLCNGTGAAGAAGSGLDHFSFLQKNGNIYMVSQFECAPGAMYMSELEQAANGQLSVKANTLQYVSQKEEFGGWVHCAGVTTPWNSHLGSEEYEPDANNASANSYYNEVSQKYWGNNAALNNPYYYGWTPEVQVNTDGTPAYTKHYSMGRFAHELAYVMPDHKTVYLSDDGTNVGLFMFIADTVEDLTQGTLYAAKWIQTSAVGAGLGEAVLSWIDLGHQTDAQIKTILNPDGNAATNDATLAFADIFTTEVPASGVCPTPSTHTYIHTAVGEECLALKDVNGDLVVNNQDIAIAARLETRRMAAVLGATTEFKKEEGITFNKRDSKLYVSMSKVGNLMSDSIGDIKVASNGCGGVYALDVAANSTIGSDYVAYSMKGMVAGTAVDYTGTALEGNTCDIDGIASPDNLTFLEGSDVLVIGEDTSAHPNDMMWAYNIKDGTMDRIYTGPYGSESTSPFWHKNINGKGYLTATTQHPFGEVPSTYVVPAGVETMTEAGYIGPFDFSKMK
jgi:secreted PhoX family phosphatase